MQTQSQIAAQTLGHPTMFLVQVGGARTPSVGQITELQWETKEALSDMHNGGVYSHMHGCRIPIGRTSGTCTGLYQCCANAARGCACAQSNLDSDGIACALGKRVPFLFYRDYACCPSVHKPNPSPYSVEAMQVTPCDGCDDPCACPDDNVPDCDCVEVIPNGYDPNGCCGDCAPAPDCGRWLWAWGRVKNIQARSDMQVYRDASTHEFVFDFDLDGPLNEASFYTWGYGPIEANMNPRLTMAKHAATVADPRVWWMPCRWSGCCDTNRFQWRGGEARSAANYFQPASWDARVYQTQGHSAMKIQVGGNFQPRTRMMTKGPARIKVSSDYCERTFDIPAGASDYVYFDTMTGQALTASSSGVVSNYTGLCDWLELECGEAVVEVLKGRVWLGLNHRWIS